MKKIYKTPETELIIALSAEHLAAGSGIDNSDQSEWGGVGAKPLADDKKKEEEELEEEDDELEIIPWPKTLSLWDD